MCKNITVFRYCFSIIRSTKRLNYRSGSTIETMEVSYSCSIVRGIIVNKHITEKSTGNFVTNIWKVSSKQLPLLPFVIRSSLSQIQKAPCDRVERVDSVLFIQWRI